MVEAAPVDIADESGEVCKEKFHQTPTPESESDDYLIPLLRPFFPDKKITKENLQDFIDEFLCPTQHTE